MAAWRNTGLQPDELRTPPAPEPLAHLMQWFRQLSLARPMGVNAPQPITWPDLAAWSGLMQLHLQPWESRLLSDLDAHWRTAWRDGREKPRDPNA